MKIELTPDSRNSNAAAAKIEAKNNGKCCECDRILGAQWINENSGWRSDNPDNPHGSWYNWNPNTGTFNQPNYSNGQWEDGKSGYGGDGAIIDAPSRVYISQTWWLSCFYCQEKGSGTLRMLGCTMWYHYKDENGAGNWGLGAGPKGPPPANPAPTTGDPGTRVGWP